MWRSGGRVVIVVQFESGFRVGFEIRLIRDGRLGMCCHCHCNCNIVYFAFAFAFGYRGRGYGYGYGYGYYI